MSRLHNGSRSGYRSRQLTQLRDDLVLVSRRQLEADALLHGGQVLVG